MTDEPSMKRYNPPPPTRMDRCALAWWQAGYSLTDPLIDRLIRNGQGPLHGGGLDFDGTDDFVAHGDINALDSAANATWMFWAYIQTVAADGFIEKGTAQIYAYLPSADTSNFATGQAGTWEKKTTTAPVVANVWAHWAVTYDGGVADPDKIVIYKNGVAQTLTGSNPGTTLSDQGANAVNVGRTQGVNYIDAILALVKVWNATLTAAEVQNEMNSYRPVRTTSLLLWSPYDDGTSARDYSGAGNHGTVTGALQVAGPPVSFGGD